MVLWNHYAFGRGAKVQDLWDGLYRNRTVRLLYVAGRGFDVRAQSALRQFVRVARAADARFEQADLLLIGLSGYQLSEELHQQTEENARAFESDFSVIGKTRGVTVGPSSAGEEDLSASNALQLGIEAVLANVNEQTDIVLDVSSLPRVTFLALLTSLLQKLTPDKRAFNALGARGVNLQVIVAEDPALDAAIRSEDPSNELITIPGFSSALVAESVQDWPVVWFPILGENRIGQLVRVSAAIPSFAEICPVLPHPSRDPRRADSLMLEYKEPLFDARQTPTDNILYVHESNPFEAYRQLLHAMKRYRQSMQIMGGTRLVVTPLASKLMTVAAGLACFEMRPDSPVENYGVAIPYVEAKRYVVPPEFLRASKPEISALVLTGEAYDPGK
jgi:hypothetical protein